MAASPLLSSAVLKPTRSYGFSSPLLLTSCPQQRQPEDPGTR
jgi:hypothetical protein